MTRILFVEGKDETSLRSIARRLASPWRLLARPEGDLFLLEATDPDEDVERAAALLPDHRIWTFEVVDGGPGG